MSDEMFKNSIRNIITVLDKVTGFIQWSSDVRSESRQEIINSLVTSNNILTELLESGIL